MSTDINPDILQIESDQDFRLQVIDNMKKYGGSFVKALAECLLRADATNRMKLVSIFPEYMEEYLPEKWKK